MQHGKNFVLLCDDMPKLSNLKELMRKLNSNWNIVSTPGDSEGVQISFYF